MKPNRRYFRSAPLFSAALRYGTPVWVGFSVIVSGLDARGGDLLRGGAGLSRGGASPAAALGGVTPTATDAARQCPGHAGAHQPRA